MISQNLQKAIDALKIQDVYLRLSQAQCAEGFRPQFSEMESIQTQQMQVVRKSVVFETNDNSQLLDVHILLGLRWIEPQQEGGDKEPEIKAFIEAEFVAEYLVIEELSQECIDEFAKKNAIYHVWPYWRELLNSQEVRLRLPVTSLPMVQLAHHKNT